MSAIGRLLSGFAFASLFWVGPMAGHELRPAIATIVISNGSSLEMEIDLDLEALISGAQLEHSQDGKQLEGRAYDELRTLAPSALEVTFRDYFSDFRRKVLPNSLSGVREDLMIKAVVVPEVGNPVEPRYSLLKLSLANRERADYLAWHFSKHFGDSVIRVVDADTRATTYSKHIVAGEALQIPLIGNVREPWFEVFRNYIYLGYLHIIPKGADHVLFVLALFLLSPSVRSLLYQVTTFTAAHTVTLALGAAGIKLVPGFIVEPLIAASIAFVAAEAAFSTKARPHRLLVTFFFGLLHGLGFATVLEEIGISDDQWVATLIGFNFGVEMGQLSVLALCFVSMGWAAGRPWYRKLVIQPLAICVCAVSLFWVWERTLA